MCMCLVWGVYVCVVCLLWYGEVCVCGMYMSFRDDLFSVSLKGTVLALV